MKNRTFLFALIIVGLSFTLAGCQSKDAPEAIYWQYWEACVDGNFDLAKELLTEDAVVIANTLGVCAFTHDAINTFEAQKGNPPRTFSQDPMVNTRDKITSISWFDDQGNLATVTLVEINGEWKVTEAFWSH